jgi:hypothetical protein
MRCCLFALNLGNDILRLNAVMPDEHFPLSTVMWPSPVWGCQFYLLCYYGSMRCPYCDKQTTHAACWNENAFRQQWNFLFTDPEENTHVVEGEWQTKTVRINGRALTGEIYCQFMQIDPLWDWESTQENCEDELRAWDHQFSWGDDSPGTFFLSLAMQRWITMRMSLMQQYFFARITVLPQADFTLSFQSDELFATWQALEGKFQREFGEFLTEQGFEPMGE